MSFEITSLRFEQSHDNHMLTHVTWIMYLELEAEIHQAFRILQVASILFFSIQLIANHLKATNYLE